MQLANLSLPVALMLGAVMSVAAQEYQAPPGAYQTSWVGNSFGGHGGPNGFGYWVQNSADEIEVLPDGTVITGSDWDEAGRCVGLYRDGRTNRVLLRAEDAPEAWSWNTATRAIAAEDDRIYVATRGKALLRFTWKPDDLDSAKFDKHVPLPDKAEAMSVRGDTLAIGYAARVEIRKTSDMSLVGDFDLPDLRDLVVAPDGTLWIIAGRTVRQYSTDGHALGSPIESVVMPTALAFDNVGRLIICDGGPRQQLLFFDVRGTPREVAAFGDEGGLLSGTPGRVSPHKLFAPRGAGTDRDGNLYVAMGFSGAPVGTLVMRSFSPTGALRWELHNLAFVDTFDFDRSTDGATVYSRTGRFDLDLARTQPGEEARLTGVTADPTADPPDPRANDAGTAIIRRLDGRRVLYVIGQYGGGYRIYTFDEPDGQLARLADAIRPRGESWAWHVAGNGDIWHGDAPNRTIRRYAFGGFVDGKPRYAWEKPQDFSWPEDFATVTRVIYEDRSDSMYVFGYLHGDPPDSWGVIGRTARRYDGWLKGAARIRWTNTAMPVNPQGTDKGGPLSAKSVAIAGDYLFVGMVKPEKGRQFTHIHALEDGSYVGSFWPGDSVGGLAGWLDMPYAVNAMQRQNGEYLILVEEDFRGKNLLYRWRASK